MTDQDFYDDVDEFDYDQWKQERGLTLSERDKKFAQRYQKEQQAAIQQRMGGVTWESIVEEVNSRSPEEQKRYSERIQSDPKIDGLHQNIQKKTAKAFVDSVLGAMDEGQPAQPQVSTEGREKLDKLKQKQVLTESEELSALDIVLGIGPDEPFIKD